MEKGIAGEDQGHVDVRSAPLFFSQYINNNQSYLSSFLAVTRFFASPASTAKPRAYTTFENP